MDRTQRILTMAKEDMRRMEALLKPHYDSTKGTTTYERNVFLERKDLVAVSNSNINVLQKENILDTSSLPENKIIASVNSAASNKKKTTIETVHQSENEERITEPSNFTSILEPKINSDINKALDSNYNINNDITSFEEPFMSSGSEYVPSDDFLESEEEEPQVKIKNKTKSTHLKTRRHSKESKSLKQTTKLCKTIKKTHEIKEKKKNTIKEWPILSLTVERRENSEQAPFISTTEAEGATKASCTNTIEILPTKTKKDGRRIRNKRHACYFCQKDVLHMARHFELCHSNEIEVAKLMALPKNSKQRREGFSELTRVGNFYHNCEVMATKSGELKLVRRPNEQEHSLVTYNDYGPCPKCLGFLLKKHLWHHIRDRCFKKQKIANADDNVESRHIVAESNSILAGTFGFDLSDGFTRNIIGNFRDDNIGIVCKQDRLILKYGAMQHEKYGATQCEYIRQQMRQLGRLTIALKEYSHSNLGLSDFLVPEKFDEVVIATKRIAENIKSCNITRPEFSIPSLALKIGHSLKKCVNLERGLALRQHNLTKEKVLMSFITLLELEWHIRISSNALATLQNRKLNAGLLVPLTADLLKLNKHINTDIDKYVQLLQSEPDTVRWSRLCTLTLARLILFNKRRAGEASKLTMQQYYSRPSWTESSNEEMKNSLTAYERELSEKLTLVYVIGKRSKRVPILLTSPVKNAIDVLIKYREMCGIAQRNVYVFARGNKSDTYVRGHDCIRKLTEEVKLCKPNLVTSTKLRKYISTVCQVFNLTPNEYDWLARHLGHDIRVHREFYRMHDDALELTKVSRLLFAVDQGEARKFAGKTLKEIELKDLPELPVEEEEEEDEGEQEQEENTDENQKYKNLIPITTEIDSNIKQHYLEENVINIKKKSAQNKNLGKTVKERRPWEKEDKKFVLEYFKVHIKNGIVPGKKECEECLAKHASLQSRKWTDLKFCIKNHITKIKHLNSKQ